MKRKIYIAGPMTGIAEYNFPAFDSLAVLLRARGHEVVNPAELNTIGTAWADCMRKDIPLLCTCDTVAMLEGWRNSRGARLEFLVATELEIEVFELPNLKGLV